MTATPLDAPSWKSTAWRAPLPLALIALLVVAVVIRFGADERTVTGVILVTVLVVVSAIDLEQRRIPNRIVLPAAALVLVLQIAFFPDEWYEWVGGAIGAALFLALPLVVVREGVGMGDLKLALLMGAALGVAVIDALLYGTLAAAVLGLVLLRRHGNEARRMGFPFGPFLAFGAIVALFTGPQLV